VSWPELALVVLVILGAWGGAIYYTMRASRRASAVVTDAITHEVNDRNADVETDAKRSEAHAKELSDDQALDRFTRRSGTRPSP
jgi:hypothetical protein